MWVSQRINYICFKPCYVFHRQWKLMKQLNKEEKNCRIVDTLLKAQGGLTSLAECVTRSAMSPSSLRIKSCLVACSEVGNYVICFLLEVWHGLVAGLKFKGGGHGGEDLSGGGRGVCRGGVVSKGRGFPLQWGWRGGVQLWRGEAWGLLLGDGTIGSIFPLNVQQMTTLRQVNSGRNGPLTGLFDDIPLAETNGGVFVTVSWWPTHFVVCSTWGNNTAR